MLKNSALNLTGSLMNAAISFLTIPILIEHLGLKYYGCWMVIVSIVGLVQLAESGLGTSSIFFMSQNRSIKDADARKKAHSETASTMILAILAISLFIASAIFFLSPYIIALIKGLNEADILLMIDALKISAIYIVFILVSQVLLGIHQAFEQYAFTNLVSVSTSLFTNLGWIAIAFLNGAIMHLAIWWVLVAGGVLAAHFYRLRKLEDPIRFSLYFNWQILRRIVSYSVFVWGGTVCSVLFNQFDRLVIALILGAEKVGIYAAIAGIARQINTLATAAVQPILPLITRKQQNTRTSELENVIKTSLSVNVLCCVGLAGLIAINLNILLPLILRQPPDLESRFSLLALCLIYAFFTFSATGYFLLYSQNKSREVFYNLLVSFLLFAAGTLIGGYFFGLLGVAVGNAGYVFTLRMLPAGLEAYPSVRKNLWRWLATPVVILLTVSGLIAASILTNTSFPVSLNILASLLLSLTLLGWFLRLNEISFNSLKNLITSNR